MSLESANPAVENNDSGSDKGLIQSLIAMGKEAMGEDNMKKLLEEMKEWPVVGWLISKTMEDSIDGRVELAGELEGNSEGRNGTTDAVQGSPEIFDPILSKYSQKYDIPKQVLIDLGDKEGSNWNTGKDDTPGSNVFGIAQATPATWNRMRTRILQKESIDIGIFGNTDPDAQIHFMAYYLKYCKEFAKVNSWEEAYVLYNMGEGGKRISDEQARNYAEHNPVIANRIPGVKVDQGNILEGEKNITTKSYYQAAYSYYNSISYEDAGKVIA